MSLTGPLIFIWWKGERVLGLDHEGEPSVSDDCLALLVPDGDVGFLIGGQPHLMPLCRRWDGWLSLLGAGVVLFLTDLDELYVTMIGDSCFADLIVERGLQCILLLELVLPGRVLGPRSFGRELLVLDGRTCAAKVITFLLFLVLFPNRRDVVVGRAVVRDLDASQCLRMKFSVL